MTDSTDLTAANAEATTTDQPEKKVLLAAPRGYCAGVDRAVVTVEKALELYGPPVYVRKQIVHNVHVVSELEKQGAIFVDEVDEVPTGSHVVFSAHGVSPAVVNAVIDALRPFGVKHADMPLTPAQVWLAIQGRPARTDLAFS